MLVAVFAMGFVAGLRTLLAPAALLLTRGGIAGYVLAAGALGEFALDLHPKAQARTRPVALAGRLVSGAVTGGLFVAFASATPVSSGPGGTTFVIVSPLAGALVGALGAAAGAFIGKPFRLWLIGRIGRVPAALFEDAVAIAIVWVTLGIAGPR